MVSEQATAATTQNSTMAASTTTMASSSSSSASSISDVNLVNQPLLLLSNMSNMMTVKLDNTNYIVWKHQISMILETYSLFELLEEPQHVPEKFLRDSSGNYTTIVNQDHLIWKSKEKALLTFISSTLTPSILAFTVGCATAIEVWKVLENRFSSISRSHIMNLKGELHNLKKGNDSIDIYLQKIKIVRDKLLAVGVVIDDEELLHIAIKGLPREYNAFKSTIRTRSAHLSFDELSTMMNAEEESLNEGLEVKDTVFAMVASTNQKPHGGGYSQHFNRGRGRGNFNHRGGRGGRGSNGQTSFNPSQFSPFNRFQQFPSGSGGAKSERPICQICGKAGHIAIDCYHRMDYAYQGKHPPTKLAAMATASNACVTQEQPWLADSAATDHVTASLNHLNFPKPYTAQDHLTVGNGQNLPITHIGTALIPSSVSNLHLRNVLRVPSITSNLASVHKLCQDNNCWCYFDKHILSIQALDTGKILYQGRSKDGVYPIYPHQTSQLTLPFKNCNSVSKNSAFTRSLWHMRLGHPHDQALHSLLPNVKSVLNKPNTVNQSFTHCLFGKMHNLHFPNSEFTASSPLELVHSDLWGSTPVNSVNGFRYYILFVDHYSRFTWLYLLESKSEAFAKFVHFNAMIENQFSSKIKTFSSDTMKKFLITRLV